MTDFEGRAREIGAGLADSICAHADFFCEVCNENSAHCRCAEHVRVRAERAITEGLTTALRQVEAETIERCAEVADMHSNSAAHNTYRVGASNIAKGIRNLHTGEG